MDMRVLLFPSCILAALLIPCGGFCDAQEAAVKAVTQVLPFASQGTVTIVEKPVAAPEVSIGTSSGTPVAQATMAKMSVAHAGGGITTGKGSAASLVLGSAGAARMEAESEVKVPDGAASGHSLELLKGKLFLNISGADLKKRGTGEFKLKTPAALLAVKGTNFFALSAAGADTIGVHEGIVVVTEPQSGGSLTLAAGNAVKVSPGVLGQARPLTAAETGLNQEYDLAKLTPLPVPSIVYQFKPLARAFTFRGGQLVTSTQSAHTFQKLDAHLWWQYFNEAYEPPGVLDISAEGFVRHVWKQKAENIRPDGSDQTAETSLLLGFRGRQLERFSKDLEAKLLLKLVALRFQYRAKNMRSLQFTSTNSHSFHAPEGHDAFQSSGKPCYNAVKNRADNTWQEVLVPLNHGDYLQKGTSTTSGNEFSTDDILVRCRVVLEDPSGQRSNKQPSLLEMKDFELLVVP